MIGHLIAKLFGVIRLKPKRTPCIIIVFTPACFYTRQSGLERIAAVNVNLVLCNIHLNKKLRPLRGRVNLRYFTDKLRAICNLSGRIIKREQCQRTRASIRIVVPQRNVDASGLRKRTDTETDLYPRRHIVIALCLNIGVVRSSSNRLF